MQHPFSLGTAQGSRKRSALVAAVAAACVASAVTFTMLTSHPSPTPATTTTTEAAAKACPTMPPLVMYVFTETGGGTVRFRVGEWVSAPITLTSQRQAVTFPGIRSQTEVIHQAGTVEGQATNVVTIGALTGHRFVIPEVNGVRPQRFNWEPYKGC
jgi:hypothetical protein